MLQLSPSIKPTVGQHATSLLRVRAAVQGHHHASHASGRADGPVLFGARLNCVAPVRGSEVLV